MLAKGLSAFPDPLTEPHPPSVEDRLELETESLKWLREKLEESSVLTDSMVGILGVFETRMEKLEKTIEPVYDETKNLQRRRENIDKTLDSLDHVIGFYNVSKEVEPVIREGLNGNGLEEHFLEAMSKLRGALIYFEKNNRQSVELENVKCLYQEGGNALSREFSELLKKHSKPSFPVELLSSFEDHHHSKTSGHFPEEVKMSLIRISEWLYLNEHDEFMSVYARVRGTVVKKSLDLLRDHQKSLSGGSVRGNSPRNFGSSADPMSSSTGATPTSVNPNKSKYKLSSSINRRLSTVSNRLEAATGVTLNRRLTGTPSSLTPGFVLPEETVEFEVESYIQSLSGLQKLMALEQGLMIGIIPSQFQKKIFEIIILDSLETFIKDGDIIVSKIKKSSASNDFLPVLSLLSIVRHCNELNDSMNIILEASDLSVRSKYKSLINGLFGAAGAALEDFLESVRNDSTPKEKLPKDGTVYQLTSNSILFLEQLSDYMDTVASVLTFENSSYNQSVLRLQTKITPEDRNRAILGIYIKKVLLHLNLTIIKKSDSYLDSFLKAVFRLNNNQYILQTLGRSGLMDIVLIAEPECSDSYNDMILEQKRLYSQSWRKVLNFIRPSSEDAPQAILLAPGKLADKHCRIIKDKFAGFNKEIEEISNTQRSYSIPDVELRESLKRDNKEFILPCYNSFYEKYVNVSFTKHREKYVKYTPAQVSALIDSFFDAAA